MRVWTFLAQSFGLCLLAERWQLCLALLQQLGCGTAFLYFSYLNYSFICCGQEGQPFCCPHKRWAMQKQRRYIWFFTFPTFRQAEKQELQAYVEIKDTHAWKRTKARKSSFYLGKCWISHWIPTLFIPWLAACGKGQCLPVAYYIVLFIEMFCHAMPCQLLVRVTAPTG